MNSPGPLVTVVTIFFNGERFLGEAVESVLAQHYQDWELLLIDDGSTDSGTAQARAYAERFPAKVRYLEHPGHRNQGAAASRNLGIREARGRYIAFLDADDVWLPQKLERQVAILEGHPDAAMVYGATEYWHGWTGAPDDLARDHTPDLGVPADRLYRPPVLATLLYPFGNGTAPCPSDLMVRRELFDAIGGFEERFTGSYQLYEDQAFLMKVYLYGAVYVSSESWDKYRLHPDSCSSQVERLGRYDVVRRFFMEWLDGYLRDKRIDAPPVRAAVARARDEEARPWRLRTADGGAARLLYPPGTPRAVRVAIEAIGNGTVFDVQLNLPRLRLIAGHRYAVRFRARSDAAREASVGVAEAHAPWGNLGWYQRIALTPAWRAFVAEFAAAKDEDNARILFDLGDSAVPVELDEVTLVHLPDGAPVEPAHSQHAGTALFGELRRLTPLSRQWGFDRGLPVDRHYIEGFLARHAPDIHGRVLEIEDDGYTRRFGGDRVHTRDVLHVSAGNPRATVIADLTNADHIPSGQFDCIILTQTLQFIYDTRAVLRTLERILAPGGVLLATFPGLSRVSQTEWASSWFWGFTTASARRLFAEAFDPEHIDVAAFGNVLCAISFLHGVATEELTPAELEYHDPDYELLITVRAVKPPRRAS